VSRGGSESDDDWQPVSDPAPSRPWGIAHPIRDLSAIVMEVAGLDAVDAERLAKVVRDSVAEKFRRTAGNRKRIHLQIPQRAVIDIDFKLPRGSTRKNRVSAARHLPSGTTFVIREADSTRIRPSRARAVRLGSAATERKVLRLEQGSKSIEIAVRVQGGITRVSRAPRVHGTSAIRK